MRNHTPGPWQVFDEEDAFYGIEGPDDVSIIILGDHSDDCGVRGGSMDEARANALLIAAAPELLEALKSLCGCISETRGSNADKALHAAKLAIEKATGGKQC